MKSALIVLAIALATISTTPAAADGAKTSSNKRKPRYTLPEGKGWSVCESYQKVLNSAPASVPPPICDLRLDRVPGMKEPDWEVLDLDQNLEVVHQVELVLGKTNIEPEPSREFDKWKRQFDERRQERGQQPRLRRARLALVDGGPVETVLSYDIDMTACQREAARAKKGAVFDSYLGLRHQLTFDEAKHRVEVGGPLRSADTTGELLLYGGKPYFVVRNFGSYDLDIGGHVIFSRPESVSPRSELAIKYPDQKYYSRQICRIRFDYPFPLR